MADDKTLPIHPALYDYILYYECSPNDWVPKRPSIDNIDGTGNTRNFIDWTNAVIITDSNGKQTKLGVNEVAWYPYVNNKIPLKNMDANGWSGLFNDVFWQKNYANKCANIACGLLLFQIYWQGYSQSEGLLNELKKYADNKEYNFIKTSSTKRAIADATHAYKDPMMAYNVMRNFVPHNYWNLASNSKRNWSQNTRINLRKAWMRRHVMAFRPDGLYIENGFCAKEMTWDSTVADWEEYAQAQVDSKRSGYKKILDWNITPEQLAAMSNASYSFSSAMGGNGAMAGAGMMSGGFSGEAYRGTHGIYQMGDFTNSPDMTITPQETQKREEVLETLIGASYTPDVIRKCGELITVDKIKTIIEPVKVDKENETIEPPKKESFFDSKNNSIL